MLPCTSIVHRSCPGHNIGGAFSHQLGGVVNEHLFALIKSPAHHCVHSIVDVWSSVKRPQKLVHHERALKNQQQQSNSKKKQTPRISHRKPQRKNINSLPAWTEAAGVSVTSPRFIYIHSYTYAAVVFLFPHCSTAPTSSAWRQTRAHCTLKPHPTPI